MSRWDAIRCVAFDFDGTLVDSNAIKREAYFEVVAGWPDARGVVEDVLASHPGADRHGVLGAVHERLRDRPGIASQEELVAAYSRICEARVSTCPAIPGALEAIRALAPQYALYLDSATPEDALVRVVALRGWQDRFQGVFGGPASKQQNLARIAAREAVSAREMVYVGDGPADRDAAAAFGCAFLGYREQPDDLKKSAGLSPLVPLVAAIYRDEA